MGWTVPDRDKLLWKAWDDSSSWVVFHPRSRQTHILDELSASVLRLMVDGCETIEDLAQRVVLVHGLTAEDLGLASEYVEKVAGRLSEAGLVDGSDK